MDNTHFARFDSGLHDAERRVAEQETYVTELFLEGCDTARAEKLLEVFQLTLSELKKTKSSLVRQRAAAALNSSSRAVVQAPAL